MRTLLLSLLLLPFICNSATKTKLEESNHIYLNQAFKPATVAGVMEEALRKDSELEEGKPIYLVLYSPCGSIVAGRELINFLKGLGRDVHTISLFATSMGFHTAQSLGKRYSLPNGTLMTHKARGGLVESFLDS